VLPFGLEVQDITTNKRFVFICQNTAEMNDWGDTIRHCGKSTSTGDEGWIISEGKP